MSYQKVFVIIVLLISIGLLLSYVFHNSSPEPEKSDREMACLANFKDEEKKNHADQGPEYHMF